jgi:2-dehydro-3-deoxy-D-gluconate 5-dehydrogenase
MILDKFNLEGKTAIVTGASRGLGQSMALGLAEAGADIVAVSTNAANLDETETAINNLQRKCIRITCDISRKGDVDNLVKKALAACTTIDILVNNAGVIRRAPAVQYSDEDWQAVIDTNLNGLFRLSREIGRQMIKQGNGKIINIASLLSFQGGINVPSYAASKGAVMQLTKALANEWASKNIQVNAIAPGYFATDNTSDLQDDQQRSEQILTRIPAARWGDPEDLKGAAVFLASSASNYINGHVLVVDGGWLAR